MMKITKITLSVLFMSSGVLALAAPQTTKPAAKPAAAPVAKAPAVVNVVKPAIVVNGESISQAEYVHHMEFLPGVGKILNGQLVEGYPGLMTVQNLVREKLVLQLAKKKGLLPTEAEINANLQEKTAANPQVLEHMKKFGLSQADFKKRIEIEIAEYKLLTEGVVVTDEDVKKYYDSNPNAFKEPKKYLLKFLAVDKPELKAKIDEEIKAAVPFEEIVKKYSIDPQTKDKGGEIMPVTDEMLNDSIKGALASIKPGQCTEWLAEGDNAFKFKLESIQDEITYPLDKKMKEMIHKGLMVQKGREKNNVDAELKKFMTSSKIEVNVEHFKDTFKNQAQPGK